MDIATSEMLTFRVRLAEGLAEDEGRYLFPAHWAQHGESIIEAAWRRIQEGWAVYTEDDRGRLWPVVLNPAHVVLVATAGE